MTVDKISVVVPCFNAELYLTEALDSIFLQAIPNLEVIVIDDGSTDGSAAVARSFGDRVRLATQSNQGISSARNTGLRLATGALIAFLDADDIWPDRSFPARLDALRADYTLGCVYGAVQHFVSPDVPENERDKVVCPTESRAGRLAGSMLITRQAFEQIGFFDEDYGVGETMEWVARAEEAGVKSLGIDAVVLRRRIHANNSVRKQATLQRDYLRALKASIDRRRRAPSRGAR